MSRARTFAVVVLAVLLTTTLATANVVAAAHLTVLDPEFVTTSVEAEGGHEVVETAVEDAAASAAPTADTGPVDVDALLADAVSEEYVASQTRTNVDRTYAYLHGERETLNLSVATAPVRENVSDGVEAQLRNASVAALMRQSDAEFDGPVNATVLERLTANESSYQATKREARSMVRDRVLDEAVDRSVRDASDDELLGLVVADYDPADYSDAEKARMVDDRDVEIRAALRERIERERGDEIDAAVEDQLRTLRQNATTAPSEGETETERAALSVRNTVVRGLTTEMSYQRFRSDLSADKADLAVAAADETDAQLAAELPERVALTGNATGADADRFEQARTGVLWLDRLAFVLPALALGLVGLLYHVRRSVTAVASATGWSLLAAVVPTVVGLEVVRSQLRSMIAEAPVGQREPVVLFVSLVRRVLDTAGDIALALAVGGILLVAGSLAARYGLVDRLRDGRGDGSGML